VERLRARATGEAAAGRLWRAKELLRSAVAQAGYDPDLYEQLGTVLLAMGDSLEAGKWLFLSARRCPEYESAIGLFLGRHGRRGGEKLYAAFPGVAQLGGPSHYPPPLCDELRELGVPEDVVPKTPPGDGTESRLGMALTVVGCGGCFLFVFVFMLVCLVVGAAVVGGWVIDRVGGWFG
jgi:hypothetical protein